MNYCCAMRQKFLLGIVAVDTRLPDPIEAVDFVMNWGEKITFSIKYCPFCGAVQGKDAARRVGEINE